MKLERTDAAISEAMSSSENVQFDVRKATRNFGWLGVDQVFRVGVGLAINILLVRYLGPERFGQFNLALYIAGISQYVAALELDRILVRDLSQRAQDAQKILGTACLLRLFAGLLSLVGTVALCFELRPGDGETILLVAVMALGNFAPGFFTIDLWFQSRYQSKFTVQAKVLSNALVNIVKLALILFGAPLSVLAITVAAEAMCTGLVLVLIYRREGGHVRAWSFDREIAEDMLRQSGTLLLAGIAAQVQARIDVIVMGRMLSTHDMGLYSAALRLVETAAFLPMIAMTSVAPLLAAANAAGPRTFDVALVAFYKLMGLLGWSVAIGFSVLSQPIVALLYGSAFAGSAPLLSLLGFRFLLACFGIGKGMFIMNMRLLWLSPVMAVVGAISNLGLSVMLISYYGAAGAIWASLLSFGLTTFVIDAFWRSTRPNLMLMLRGLCLPWTFRLSQLDAPR